MQAIDNARSVAFRGVKLNLPWNSYRVHPSLTRHAATMERPEFWQRLISYLAECGFNALTLWAIHPWSLMVRPDRWPDACAFDDAELARWQRLWRTIFTTGAANGIDVIPVCFNIFVSPELARARGLAPYSADLSNGYYGDGDYSEEVRAYNRDALIQVIDTYPQIGGIGVSQNERMDGVPLETWQRWIADTYFDIAERHLADKTFIVRAHTRPKPEMTRAAIESYPGRLPARTLVDVKFNWSHGHATPEFHYMHEGASDAPLYDPPPTRYKLVYTVRNEDFFGLDYGCTDFMRELIAANARPDTAGFIIGSECLIPADEFVVKPGVTARDRGWEYLFERQPLFWCGWGTLLRDPSASDAKIAERIAAVTAGPNGPTIAAPDALLEAANRACRTANRIASSIASTWDFTLYTEGLIKGARQEWFGQPFDDSSPLIGIGELADARPLDPGWARIRDWVASESGDDGGDRIAPAERIAALEADCHRAIELLDALGRTPAASPIDEYERASIRAWALLGLCFARRIAAAVALCVRDAGSPKDAAEAAAEGEAAADVTAELARARAFYADLCDTLDPWIPAPYDLLHLGDNFNRAEYRVGIDRFHHRSVLGLMDEEIER
ncbi:MAG: hypothetical protein EA382_17725, partial [Spirochaetaceae bacterium]